jgi:Xaa-Pro aminopeptidase
VRNTPKRGFPVAEFEARTAKAQRLMHGAGLDALLFCTEPEVRYFSGFLTPFWQSPTRPWFLVLPREGKPIAVIPGIGAETMAATWIDDIRTWDSPNPSDEGVTLLSDTLHQLGAVRVGLPMGEESMIRMALSDLNRIRDLAGVDFIDAGPIIRACRFIKSEAEITKIAHICSVASNAFDRVPSIISAGMPLSEAFRAMRIELLAQGADEVPYLVGGAGQGGYADVISPPNERPLESGDVLMFDTGSTFDGYFCDFDRNYAIGEPDEAARQAYRTLYAATEAALAVARPGARCADLYRAMVTEIGGDGGGIGRMGHGLGMQLTELPSHMPTDQTILEPGMVLTLEPSMTVSRGRMMVHEENIVIREDGADLLSRRAAPELQIL